MKNFIFPILMIAALLAGCKKDKEASSQSIIGKWEFRSMTGGQVAGSPSTVKAGNGNIIEFTDTEYQNTRNGTVVSKKTYVVVKDSANIDGTSYSNALIYDNESLKWYFSRNGDKLMLSIGSIALDGFTLTYQKVK